jgi:hypothetical protein
MTDILVGHAQSFLLLILARHGRQIIDLFLKQRKKKKISTVLSLPCFSTETDPCERHASDQIAFAPLETLSEIWSGGLTVARGSVWSDIPGGYTVSLMQMGPESSGYVLGRYVGTVHSPGASIAVLATWFMM